MKLEVPPAGQLMTLKDLEAAMFEHFLDAVTANGGLAAGTKVGSNAGEMGIAILESVQHAL